MAASGWETDARLGGGSFSVGGRQHAFTRISRGTAPWRAQIYLSDNFMADYARQLGPEWLHRPGQ